jgi:hypothetical protein
MSLCDSIWRLTLRVLDIELRAAVSQQLDDPAACS